MHDNELGALGSHAYGLRERLRRDADQARAGTFAAATSLFNGGLDLGAALTQLSEAWNTQSRTLVDACGHISNHLDFTRSQHSKDDVKVATEVSTSRITEYYR
ncbi:hypothetical protein [Streptomyces triticagri]|uniref:hypothetical protein n=1 Tax=Streptomyces triticagri TaxID=2293568 RepID=UPI001F30C2BD|nr:hypothetical protein [Streptomyces triticagri]